jgi:hypothetical protein
MLYNIVKSKVKTKRVYLLANYLIFSTLEITTEKLVEMYYDK